MSDDEEQYDEDEEQEPEDEIASIAEEGEEVRERKKFRGVTQLDDREREPEALTEAGKAMQAAKKRQEEDQMLKLLDYEEKRRIEREKEEEEMRQLKEKQERRRQEREEEERQFAERRRQEQEARRIEEEERKARLEADRRKKEEKLKKQQRLAGFATAIDGQKPGRNFVILKKKQKEEKIGNIFQAKQEMGMTKEQQKEAKKAYLAAVARSMELAGRQTATELKDKIKQLHLRISKLEADKYDLEKRHERQEYDLKELNERQRQVFRSNARKKGVDPVDPASTKYPPKVSLISKYERQIDRRNFAERRAVYENRNAHPCFPNVPPPPTIYKKIVLSEDTQKEVEAEVDEQSDVPPEEEDE